jgi:hypothetical protein
MLQIDLFPLVNTFRIGLQRIAGVHGSWRFSIAIKASRVSSRETGAALACRRSNDANQTETHSTSKHVAR